MAIAFRSHTSVIYASRTNTVLTAPAGLADGDILIGLIVTATGGTPPTPTAPAGFAAFGTATVVNDGSFQGRFSIYWKRAASESGSYTWTHATCSSQGVLKAYSGCKASGTPLGATANATSADGGSVSQTTVGSTITTTAANSFLLFEAHDWTGGGTLSPPSGMTERFDNLIYSADQLIASAGATGTRTQTNGNVAASAEQWAARMVELLVDTGGGGTTYNDTTAETASAAETAGGLLTTTKAVAETAASAETATGLLVTTKAVAEAASAADTLAGLLAFTGAIAESASAAEATDASVVPAGAIDVTVAETASAADTVASTLVALGAVAESASANDNVDATGGALVLPEVPTQVPGAGPPGPDGTDRRRFEIFLLEDEDEEGRERPKRKRRLRLKKAELEEKIEATVEYIAAGSPRPMAPRAMVAEASTLMGLDALLENDRRRVERTIYRYLQTLMEEEEEEEAVMMLLAA